jgi:outer membrane lipoprotein-sorting protein
MRTFIIAATMFWLWSPSFIAQLSTRDAVHLLEEADRFRGDWPSVRLKTRIENFDHGRLTESADFEVAIKGENSLVTFLSPKNKGQVLLMRGDDMWLYLPAVSRGVRITAMQRLLGNASNGDVARLRYAIDYSATVVSEESVDEVPCVALELRAKRPSAAYQRIRYMVRKSDGLPITADYFLASGRAIKSAKFSDLRTMAGRAVITRIVIADQIKHDYETVMTFESVSDSSLSDTPLSRSPWLVSHPAKSRRGAPSRSRRPTRGRTPRALLSRAVRWTRGRSQPCSSRPGTLRGSPRACV